VSVRLSTAHREQRNTSPERWIPAEQVRDCGEERAEMYGAKKVVSRATASEDGGCACALTNRRFVVHEQFNQNQLEQICVDFRRHFARE
jgi:hypothetical protein